MVHFVGAGSGAPDLITVRGARLLGEADVVIYAGSLVNPALLDATKPGCEIHDSAKMTLEEVIAVIRQAEAEGKTTVRLHTGDSSIYGAVREQFDALEKLGIESPVTLEDWENYWHLVKTTDLNGNGTNDEIPFSSYDMTGLRNFCTAFGCLDDFYTDPDDGGKVHYGPIDPKYKEAVTWMHDMYEKGYIDPEIITMDYASFVPKLAQNTVASFYGPLGGMLAAQNATMPASFPGFHVEATVPPKGTAQIHSYIDQEPRAIAAATITASCKNVDRVIALLDYMYSDEGTLLINMGIEGTHYTMQDGKPIFTDYVMKNPDGLSPKNAIGTFTFAQSSGPFILSQDEVTQLDDDSVNRAKQDCIIPFLEESKKYVIPGSTSFSSEDDAVRRAVMADVDTYVDEMIIKFVSGREPLSNWDTYVEKVNGMGIAEVIDIYQKTLNG